MTPPLDQALADELERHVADYAADVTNQVIAELPAFATDEDLVALALESSRALLADFATVLRLGLDSAPLQPPSVALGFVQRLARAGVPLADVLRSYRLGQELMFARAAHLAREVPGIPDRLAAVERVGALSFRYTDAAMTDVAHEYDAERERYLRGAIALRHAVIRDLLAGTAVDPREAERILGHRLDGPHLAVVAWAADGAADADRIAGAVRPLIRALGRSRPLVITEPSGEVGVWAVPDARQEPGGDEEAALAAAGVRAAIGEAGEGVAGFVASRRQADLARSVARSTGAGAVTRYRDVALVALLLRDRDAARAFAIEELGDAAAPARAAAELRRTLAAFFAAGHDQSRTARRLGVHRNTVAKRLQRAESLIGHPLDVRVRELDAALAIADVLAL